MYVNYGRIDDFLYLTNGTFLKLDLSKYICIARYGGIYRGDKVKELLGERSEHHTGVFNRDFS